jgi:alpha-L-fucosidase
MPNGEVQPEFVSRLDSVGKWMNRFGESVYETSGGIVTDLPWGTVTGKGGTLYIHLLDTASQKISIDNFPYKKILKLTTLADGQEVKYKLEKTKLSIDVSSIKKEENDTVLKMEVKQ